MLDEDAGVFNDGEASGASLFGGRGVFDAELEPEDFRANGDGGIGDGRNVLRAAKNVNDIDGLGDVFKAGIAFFAEHFGFVGIDRNDAVAGALEIRSDFMGGPQGIG